MWTSRIIQTLTEQNSKWCKICISQPDALECKDFRLGNITQFVLFLLIFFCNRLDLCNSWDKETVKSSSIKTSEGHIDPKQVVFFYAIDCTNKPVKPVEINPKPKAIKATYKIHSRNSKLLLAVRNSENYPQRYL